MPQNDSDDKDVKLAEISSRNYEIHEKQITYRYYGLFALIFLGIMATGYWYVQATQPAWVGIVTTIIAGLSSSGSISLPLIRLYRRNTKRLIQRNEKLEALTVSQQAQINSLQAQISQLQPGGARAYEINDCVVGALPSAQPLPQPAQENVEIQELKGGRIGE